MAAPTTAATAARTTTATGTEPTELLRDALPAGAVDLLGDASLLADPIAIVVGCALCYWFLEHERGARVVATTLFALGLAVLAKELVAWSRPPEALWLAEASRYGFPSGHAVGAVVLYGLAARHASLGSHPARVAGASAIAVVVGLSRVALGVHYLTDVLGGVALGLLVLAAAPRLDDVTPALPFAAAAFTAGAAAVLAGGTYENALIVAGGGLAGAAWPLLAPVPTASRRALAAVGAVALAAGAAVLALAGSIVDGPIPLLVGGTVITGLILVTPHGAARLGAVREASARATTSGG